MGAFRSGSSLYNRFAMSAMVKPELAPSTSKVAAILKFLRQACGV